MERETSFEDEKIKTILTGSGRSYEVFMPENPRERILFTNEYCEFKPVGWIRTDLGWLPLGYKVVTEDLESLGLRNNPTPMKFPVGEWVFEERNLQYGSKDYGGIWTAVRRGSTKVLKKHCLNTWGMKTRGFLTAIYNPVAFVGNYRIKSEGVMLVKEVL